MFPLFRLYMLCIVLNFALNNVHQYSDYIKNRNRWSLIYSWYSGFCWLVKITVE